MGIIQIHFHFLFYMFKYVYRYTYLVGLGGVKIYINVLCSIFQITFLLQYHFWMIWYFLELCHNLYLHFPGGHMNCSIFYCYTMYIFVWVSSCIHAGMSNICAGSQSRSVNIRRIKPVRILAGSEESPWLHTLTNTRPSQTFPCERCVWNLQFPNK